MVNRPLQPRLPKPPGSSTEGVYSQVSLPVTTPPLLHLRSPSTAPKKRKQWPAQPAPSVPVHVVAPEEPLAPQGHLSKYRVLFNKAMMQKPLAASELHIGNASGKPNLCATVQYTSAGSASIADGCRVFMSEAAFLQIPPALRPHPDRSAACEVASAAAPHRFQVTGTSYVWVVVQESRTGHGVVAHLYANVVARSSGGKDFVIGAATPAVSRWYMMDERTGDHDVVFEHGEAVIVKGIVKGIVKSTEQEEWKRKRWLA